MKVTIPTSLSEITLIQYLNFKNLITKFPDDESFVKTALITHFCGLSIEETARLSAKDFNDISQMVVAVLGKEPQHTKIFILDGKEYGFIPNLDEMSAGEYATLDKYFGDPDMQLNTMATLYRPVTGRAFGMYHIEPFETSEKYKDVMARMPLEAYLSAQVFFYRLSSELLRATRTYLASPQTQTLLQEADLQNVGDGINHLTQLLQDAESQWNWLQSLTSTHSFTISNTEPKKQMKPQDN